MGLLSLVVASDSPGPRFPRGPVGELPGRVEPGPRRGPAGLYELQNEPY